MNLSKVVSNSLVVFVASIILTGCTINFSLPEGETAQFYIYHSGRPVYERELRETDPVQKILADWLAANPDGWRVTLRALELQYFVKGEDYSINIQEDKVIINFCRSFYNCYRWVKRDTKLFSTIQQAVKRR